MKTYSAEDGKEVRFWRKVDGICVICGTYEAKPTSTICVKCHERGRSNQKKSYARLKRVVHENYGSCCGCCGESQHEFLTIDHVHNDGCIERRTPGTRSSIQILRKIIAEGFPDSYQILCMNCNFGKSRNGGTCPHKHERTS